MGYKKVCLHFKMCMLSPGLQVAAVTILERLKSVCIEKVLPYPWMCHTEFLTSSVLIGEYRASKGVDY